MNFFIVVKDARSFQYALRSFCFIAELLTFQQTVNE